VQERTILLLAAASAAPTEAALRDRKGGPQAIERAEELGLIELDGGRVLFSHPLLASTLYGMATTTQRRSAHRTLAGVAGGPEDRARHLALAVAEPDAAVADALENAAEAAARRGAAAAATELLELAVRRTPEAAVEERLRRQLALAWRRFRDGDATSASTLAKDVRDGTSTRRTLAEALILEAEIAFESGVESARELAAEAIRVAGDDRHLAARAHTIAANVEYDDMEDAWSHARQASALLDTVADPDPDTAALALRASVGTRLVLGLGFDRAGAERALELEHLVTTPLRVSERPSASFGVWFGLVDELDSCRTALEATYRDVLDEGDDSSLPYVLGHLSTLEWRTGNWERARALAAEQLEIADAAGQSLQRGAALYRLGVVDVSRGDVDLGRSEAEESLRLALDQWEQRRAEWLLGFLALSLGDVATARSRLELADDLGRRLKLRDPGVRQEALDLAEALVGLGELDRARALVEEYEALAVRLDRPSGRAAAARTRALVLSACGDHVAAVSALAEALEQHERVRLPLELGRTYLVLGQVERRQRHKRLAQEALARAEELFGTLGARLWLSRTREELARIGLRRRSPTELTDTERRVADLAATGLTNRQVAKELFMSPRTVEAHIGKIYAKLGIHSRAELGRALDDLSP
jgi:DNA-binding CsgD family transcriptional regulator